MSTSIESRIRTGPRLALLALCCACGDGGGGEPQDLSEPPPALTEARAFRAIAGVSMGGYGALNLGTKRNELFSTIASLGGPVDLEQLLEDGARDNLEVKPQTDIPRTVGADFTFDHLAPYPDRDTRVRMFQDLVLAFGNPYLHHDDPERQYLASDSEPARVGRDDQFGDFVPPTDPRGFHDGGDANEDGLRQVGESAGLPADVALLAAGSVRDLAPDAEPTSLGGRALVDLTGDGIYDVGDGIVVNTKERFSDLDGDGRFDPDSGESFFDDGLDGVPGTGDFGEGNGVFDVDPDRLTWLSEDPLTRVREMDREILANMRLYMDVGLQDEFEFAAHYDTLVATLRARGLSVAEQEGFDSNCADLPGPEAERLLVRYDAGHIGVASVDPDDLLDGNVCGQDTVWQRILTMTGFLHESFPDGLMGTGLDAPGFDFDFDDFDIDVDLPDPSLRGDTVLTRIASPALALPGGDAPMREVLVYRPPAFEASDRTLPIVYFLVGYGQRPEDYERVAILFDALILSGQMQNMFFAFLPGDGGRQGSFYVNQSVPESQAPELSEVTSGRYEDSIFDDLMPVIENEILERRVRLE